MGDSWPELSWVEATERVTPLVFRIYAGSAAGTGFVVSISNSTGPPYRAVLATAWHVISDVVTTGEQVRLVSSDREHTFQNGTDSMHIQQLGHEAHDTVMILLQSSKPILEPKQLLPMLPWQSQLARGAEIAWLGYPGLVEPELCFFGGHVSGYIGDPPTYLVDGVAINGVSGGPAFDRRGHLIGLVSAYIPNRVDESTTLPGLMALVPINAIRMFIESNMKAVVQ